MSTHFTWNSYRAVLRKARRDLVKLQGRIPAAGDETYMDDVFNLVSTINAIEDWVSHYSDEGKAASKEMRQARLGDPSLPASIVRGLCNGLKHAEPWTDTPATLVVASRPSQKSHVRGRVHSGVRSATNSMKNRGGSSRITYVVDVAGERRSVVLVAAQALEAWTKLLNDHSLPSD
jgi:hypothetical protein